MNQAEKRDGTIVLLGVGHTNAEIVHLWCKSPIPNFRLVCVSRFAFSTYSGMLPGTLADQFKPQQMQIDLPALTNAAGAELILGEVKAMDDETQTLHFADGSSLAFDILSVGVGSMPAGVDTLNGKTVVPIKPMQTFLQRLDQRINETTSKKPTRIKIIGGGVAGIEIALCLATRCEKRFPERSTTIEVLTGSEEIANGMSKKAISRLRQLLQRRNIEVRTSVRAVDISDTSIHTKDQQSIPADVVILATGAVGPAVLSHLGLPTDKRGFLATRRSLQTTKSDLPIFAVGDCGTVINEPSPKAGVYAVRQAPILWGNLNHLTRGEKLEDFRPQSDFLKIVNTGDGKALLQYKGWVFHSRWCWWLKCQIDSRFMRKYQQT
ncbi:NADH dehydrogenase [Planctomycetes bacterium CA13]|uniref:NADH dehydrogenase n=1 Tax=Novipirellula herctigrandis TaxID=2527986 RepID=A0A5C5YY98_9BACT|nr:NADH dehydrogenase [Planctomycetes bacterium CA13]